MRKKSNKQIRIATLIIIVFVLTLGYAYLTQTLNINGLSSIKNATWNIYWDNVQVSDGSVETEEPVIDTNKTTVTFSVRLSKPGDFYEFTVDAKNDGSIDAMIESISSKLNNIEITNLPSYLDYKVTYSDGAEIKANQLLDSNTKETYKIRVEFKKDITPESLPSSEENLNISFSVTYIQKNDSAILAHAVCKRATTLHYKYDSSTITYGNLGTAGILNSGDAFDCDVNADGLFDSTTERFYYVSPTNADESGEYVTLIYYNNVTAGIPDNQNSHQYSYNIYGMNGPDVAALELPTTTQWSNSKLNNNFVRQIKTKNGNTYFRHDGTNYNLPVFYYENRAARLLATDEFIFACGDDFYTNGVLDNCNYFLENTVYDINAYNRWYWLETWYDDSYFIIQVDGLYKEMYSNTVNCPITGVRPVIEVKKIDIEY